MDDFLSWLVLNQCLPSVFQEYSYCSIQQWEFLTLDMPQWLIGVFAVYLVVGMLVLVSYGAGA
ncbi:disulfide bond formation protein B [Xenorhabdus sp. 42]|uniref:Disulfide bond formation protein B n=1 Tax=Xenorhabdus szentirmaii TaxID=290112 RepID=A0AAW3YZD1_9GAMM|nr:MULTISPECIES: disulfide bond formation protein B [unclassified Xenorhabdus]MBD2780927.1 disulfide bond formation protein B [Xenorhabdus sp. 38]MBD2792549.1 disulfide bond formation protein B [Xenorhabdus sp. CUL]MBD2801603.1 disulfide bond formation protein B [Xenorhabdus sp. M]MBD2805009.1 disulfide bond formation protein B [Xenorhabdus sp. ZM]MBD2819207.1 disulfide bond formation protein B [Xenorhabdus sp. 42]